MATVRRDSFTRLSGGEGGDEQFSFNIIFVHGLRGHPRATWEATPAASIERSSDATKKHKGFKSLFKQRVARPPSTSTAQANASSSQSSNVFWPEQYLVSDIPQARVWMYGYNADVIGGLFRRTTRTVSPSMGGICQPDLRGKSRTEGQSDLLAEIHALPPRPSSHNLRP